MGGCSRCSVMQKPSNLMVYGSLFIFISHFKTADSNTPYPIYITTSWCWPSHLNLGISRFLTSSMILSALIFRTLDVMFAMLFIPTSRTACPQWPTGWNKWLPTKCNPNPIQSQLSDESLLVFFTGWSSSSLFCWQITMTLNVLSFLEARPCWRTTATAFLWTAVLSTTTRPGLSTFNPCGCRNALVYRKTQQDCKYNSWAIPKQNHNHH